MALTTREAVLGVAPELAALSPTVPPASYEWAGALSDADVFASVEVYGAQAGLAARLYAAHVLTLNHPELEKRQLSSVTLGGMSKSFTAGQGGAGAASGGDEWLQRTRHGQQLLYLQRGLAGAHGPFVL